jgi:hypothetical protein
MSFMDRKNILSEGFFDFLKKLPSQLKGMSKVEKKLYKSNPEFKKSVDTFMDAYNDMEKRRAARNK